MTWYYGGETVEETVADHYFGFVYLITRVSDGKKYIGQKVFWNTLPPLKGSRKRRKKASDWLSYYGSSEELKEDVQKMGKQAFHREITHFCSSKSWLNIEEATQILSNKAIQRDDYYNKYVNIRVSANQLKLK